MISKSSIKGFGAYVPERVLSNTDLEAIVDTNDEWIQQRTGMKERRIAGATEFASHLAIGAVEDLVARNEVTIDDVDQIIVTTFTPDCFTPTVSALVQAHFDIPRAGSFDLNAGCTGFAYGLSVADALISSEQCKKVLVIASETVSKAINYQDRTTCVLFGDAAAACLLERSDGEGAFLASRFDTDGAYADNITCANHAQVVQGTPIKEDRVVEQKGQLVYKYVMKTIPAALIQLLESAELTLDDIDWFVPHSANMRMIQTVCNELDFPLEQTLTSLEYYGNTSSASIPLSLWIAQNEGRLQAGQLLALYGFGGGLTHGGVIVRL